MEIRPDVMIKIASILKLSKDATDLDLLEAIIRLDYEEEVVIEKVTSPTPWIAPSPYVTKPRPYFDNEDYILD